MPNATDGRGPIDLCPCKKHHLSTPSGNGAITPMTPSELHPSDVNADSIDPTICPRFPIRDAGQTPVPSPSFDTAYMVPGPKAHALGQMGILLSIPPVSYGHRVHGIFPVRPQGRCSFS